MRSRILWLDVATLPGAIAPFLPFIEFFRDLSLFDCLINRIPPDSTILLVPPAFLPIYILVWLWRRHSAGYPATPTWPVLTSLLAVAAMASSAIGTLGMQAAARELSDLGWTAAFLLPIVANVGLWWRNYRLHQPTDTTSETLLLGTYVATTLPWTLFFLSEGALVGAWVIVGVGAAYLVAIAGRLNFQFLGTSRRY